MGAARMTFVAVAVILCNNTLHGGNAKAVNVTDHDQLKI
jgi:hypothetical protein